MKRLYARLVLWLIRPALAEREVGLAADQAVGERINAISALCASNTALIQREIKCREAAEATGSAGRS